MEAVDVEAEIKRSMEETQRRRMELRAEMAAMRQQAREAAASAPWWEVDCPPNMVNVDDAAGLHAALDAACAQGRLVVVNFFSPDCYACRSLQPKLRQIAGAAGEAVLFLKVNGFLDGLREYCEEEGVTKIPYFRLYRRGTRVSEFTANMNPERLNHLRRQIAMHSADDGDASAAAVPAPAAAQA